MNGSHRPPDVSATAAAPPSAQEAALRREAVLDRIAKAAGNAGRQQSDVALLAVSKTFPGPHVLAMAQAGQRSFGENYLQEALAKQQWLSDNWSGEPLEWHFIGPIQSNKTRPVAEHFDWAHTVDRMKIARRLSDQRPADLPPLNICLQVNIDDETSKSGCAPAQAPALAAELLALPRLRLRGLMAIPRPAASEEQQQAVFARVRALFEQCLATVSEADPTQATGFDTLSMGMTADLEAAVAQGATIVRIGTALFGARAPK